MRADDDTTWQGITVLVGGKEIGRMKTWKSSDNTATDDVPTIKGLIRDHYVEEEFEVETLSEEEAHLTLDAQLDMWGFFKDRAR